MNTTAIACLASAAIAAAGAWAYQGHRYDAQLAELMVDIAIRNGIAMGLEYKAIYQLAKERVKHLVPSIQLIK